MKTKIVIITKGNINMPEILAKVSEENTEYFPIIVNVHNVNDLIDIMNNETFDLYIKGISNEETIKTLISILHICVINGSQLGKIYTGTGILTLPEEIWGRCIELLRNDNEFYKKFHEKFITHREKPVV